MSQNFIIIDHCNCPRASDNHGRMQEFHVAADELEIAIKEFFGGKDADN